MVGKSEKQRLLYEERRKMGDALGYFLHSKAYIREKKVKKRFYNYDYLRALACLAVVFTHVTHLYFFENGNIYSDHVTFYVADFFRILTTFGVPCFVMLSGAFNLEYSKNNNYIEFYKKSLIKLGVPTLLFIFMSVIYKLFLKHLELEVIITDIIKGVPFDHLWYMYMLVGLYFITPLLKHLAHDLTDKQYCITSITLCILGVIVKYTCSIIWPIRFLQFLGYYLLGYYIKRRFSEKRGGTATSYLYWHNNFVYVINDY